MKKISKKILIVLVLVLGLFGGSCSCSNKGTTYEHGLDITVSENLKPYFLNISNYPVLHFDYDGVKVIGESAGAAYFFVNNDQYELSDKFAEHLSQYNEDDIYIISCEDQTRDDGKAIFAGEKLTLDEFDEKGNPQPYSKEYQIVCNASDGTRYSYQYRTFVSGGKRYYVFRYSSNIGISLEQSIMVINKNGENKLVLLPLPFDTKYEVSGANVKDKNLLSKDTYLDEKYYKFAYSETLSELSLEQKEEKVKEWYISHCNGFEGTDGFIITYYGIQFKVLFGISDASNTRDKDGFQLIYYDGEVK